MTTFPSTTPTPTQATAPTLTLAAPACDCPQRTVVRRMYTGGAARTPVAATDLRSLTDIVAIDAQIAYACALPAGAPQRHMRHKLARQALAVRTAQHRTTRSARPNLRGLPELVATALRHARHLDTPGFVDHRLEPLLQSLSSQLTAALRGAHASHAHLASVPAAQRDAARDVYDTLLANSPRADCYLAVHTRAQLRRVQQLADASPAIVSFWPAWYTSALARDLSAGTLSFAELASNSSMMRGVLQLTHFGAGHWASVPVARRPAVDDVSVSV
jgi:hypothetical protein